MTKKAHRHMLWAMLLGILSIGISVTIKISAQTTSLTVGTNIRTYCSYTTGDWSTCDSSGIQTRSVTPTPSGCIDTSTKPASKQTCTYTAPSTSSISNTITSIATPCTYTYSSWGECSSSGIQTRDVVSKTPSGCYEIAVKILSQPCTYVPATTNTNTTTNITTGTSTATACTYALSDWNACSTSGTQNRTILSRNPSGCYDSNMPTLQRTCTYTTSITTGTNTTSSATTSTISSNSVYACSYSYSNWSVCDSSGKQTRVVTAKNPSGCNESAVPYTEQSCSYNTSTSTTTNSGTACAYILSDWSTCTGGKQTRVITSKTPSGCTDYSIPETSRYCMAASLTTNNSTSNVKPEFNFLNINGGEVLNGTVNIEGTVANANSVEFYLVPSDSNISKYLGSAKLDMTKNIWRYSFESGTQPNGSYYLKTQIKNVYGSYEGGQRMVVVLNKVADAESVISAENSTVSESSSISVVANIDQTNTEWQNKYFKSETCVDQNICGGMADPDKDGLNNNDEQRYGTSPTNPDSDGDGFLDGDEVAKGFNPLKAAPADKSDKIVFENPKEFGEIKDDTYKVSIVEYVQNENGENNLKISGKGIPNSFVTIYVYSDPIIFTIKTDNEGNWSYVLDKNVEDGEHEVYVAVTDNTGKITGKSVAMGFVKTAQAVSVIPPAEAASSAKAISPTSSWYQNEIFIFVALALAGLALALAALGLVRHHLATKRIEELQQ